MNETEYKEALDFIVYLCACAINKVTPQSNNKVNLDHVFEITQKHMITSIVGQMLQRASIPSEKFKKSVAMAQRKTVILEYEVNRVTGAFEKQGIWYMPMKGVVLKEFYPGYAMREMCDCDVLVDETRASDVKTIMETLGFQTTSFGENKDDCYILPPSSNFEIHRTLFSDIHEENLYHYYLNVKDRLVKDVDNDYGYHFTAEDFYVYMIAHDFKHYKYGGTGLRSLLDTYVFLKSTSLDMDYVQSEIQKIGISTFECRNRELACKLFDQIPLSKDEQNELAYYVSSGTFGTVDHRVENYVQKKGRIRYLLTRVFGPIGKNNPFREQFKKKYAFFFRHPLLLPFLPFYRFLKAVFASPKRLKNELRALKRTRKR